MKTLYTLLFVCFTAFTYAQNAKIDSMKRELEKTGEDTVKFLCLSNLAWQYDKLGEMENAFLYAKKASDLLTNKNISNPKYKGEGNYLLAVLHYESHQIDSALVFAKKALEEFEQIDNPKLKKIKTLLVGKTYNLLSSLYGFSNNQTRALYYLEKSYSLNENANEYKSMAFNLHNISIAYKFKGQYSVAIEKAKKTLELIYKHKITNLEQKVYLNIGNIYFDWQEYHKAIPCFHRVVEIGKKENNKKFEYIGYGSLGRSYTFIKEKDSAVYFLNRAYSGFSEINDIGAMISTLGNISAFYASDNVKDYKKALEYEQQGWKLSEEAGDSLSMIYSRNNMAFIYDKMGDFQKAISLYLISYQQMKEKDLGKLKISNDLALLYEKTGDYKQAYLYSQECIVLKDSIFKKDKLEAYMQQLDSFGIVQKQAEVEVLSTKNEIQALKITNQYYVIISVFLMFSILAVAIWLFQRQKTKKARTQAAFALLEAQKERLEVQQKANQLRLLEFQKQVLERDVENKEEIITDLENKQALLDLDTRNQQAKKALLQEKSFKNYQELDVYISQNFSTEIHKIRQAFLGVTDLKVIQSMLIYWGIMDIELGNTISLKRDNLKKGANEIVSKYQLGKQNGQTARDTLQEYLQGLLGA